MELFMKIKARFDHFNINVTNLEKSIEFYQKALGLHEAKRKEAQDGSFTLVYLQDDYCHFMLELTYLKDRTEPYNLGDNESHICFRVENDYEECFKYHQQMGCVCYVNEKMGLYFIHDPDDYWIDILKVKHD